MHCLEVLLHAAGVYKLKGVDEPVSISCVSLADAYQAGIHEQERAQEQLSTKVERLSTSSELLESIEVTIPVLPAASVGTEEQFRSGTAIGAQLEKQFKAAYVDFGWNG